MQVKRIPIATAKNHAPEKVLFLGAMSGKMYAPKTPEDLADEEFSPMLTALLIEDEHTQGQIIEHWNNKGTLTF